MAVGRERPAQVAVEPRSLVAQGQHAFADAHGGIILVEAGGRVSGGDAHWILPIAGDTYVDSGWHQWNRIGRSIRGWP